MTGAKAFVYKNRTSFARKFFEDKCRGGNAAKGKEAEMGLVSAREVADR
jgi:hypothetical protein